MNSIYLAVQSLFSHWRRHPGQALTLVLGLALATALWSGVQAINAEARSSYDRAAAALGQDRLSRLITSDGSPVAIGDYVALRRAGYRVSPVISGVLRGDGARLRLLGIDPLTAPPETQAPAFGGSNEIDLAAFMQIPGLMLVSQDTLNRFLPPDLPPLVQSETVPPGAGLTDIATAARLLGQSAPSYLLVWPDQPAHLPPLQDATRLTLAQPQSGSDIAQLTDSFHLNLTAFALLSFAVGLFIVNGTIGLAFEQRRSSFRTMRALGLPLGTLLTALALETLIFAVAAGGFGLILGYLIAAALMPGVAGTLQGLYGAEVAGSLTFDPIWALAGLGMTLLGAGLAAAQAMRRTAQMPILAAAQPRAWAVASTRTMRFQAVIATGLLVGSAALAVIGGGLVAGFASLAGLLLGAALLLPGALALFLRVAGGLGRTEVGEWLLADTRQQVPRLSLALMALLLALAANIGVSTMVGSFRATFTGWLDQRLVSELYVNVATEAEARRLQDWLGPRAEAVLPVISVERTLLGAPGDIYAMADHATFRDHWPLLSSVPDAWDQLAEGAGVLVNEQLARRHDLALGDQIEISAELRLPIAAIFSDYGNPRGQIIVSDWLFRDVFPGIPLTRFAVRTPPGDAAALAAAMREDFGLPADAVVNQSEIKVFSLSVFEQTFLVTHALNILTLGVAGFALLTGLLTLANLRLPQLAPVWAIGMTRGRLAVLELARSLVLASLTFFLALPFGLLLAWLLLAVVNVEAFGWRLPMQVFPADWLRLFLMALIAAGIAAALPALRLARTQPARLIGVFSNDR